MSQVGAINTYDRIMDKYKSFPLVPDVKANLVNYTLQESLNGIFTILAKKEAAIRNNPSKH